MSISFGKTESNAVKGVAILLLLFHHLFLHRNYLDQVGMSYSVQMYHKVFPFINMARICVWIFAFISAYGLTIKFNTVNERTNLFVLKQWLRLMWKWWIVWLFMIILYTAFIGNPAKLYGYSIKALFLDFMEWNDFFDEPRVLGSWYLCFAQLLIILLPVLDLICKTLGIWAIPTAYIFLQYVGEGIVSTGGGRYSQYFLVIIAGVCLAQDSMGLFKQREHKLTRVLEAIGFPVWAGTFLIIQYKLTSDTRQISTVLRMLAVVLIVLAIVKYLGGTIKKILVFMGKNSAVMFISNVFFYSYFSNAICFTKNPIVSYILFVEITLLFAYLINFIGEKSNYNKLLANILNLIDQWEIRKEA